MSGVRTEPGGRAFPLRPEHVAAHVETLLRGAPDARVIGIHASGRWTGDEAVEVAGVVHPLAWCESALAVREALDRHERDAHGSALVILTGVPEDELGWDVLVRLPKRRLREMEPWDVVRDLFRARTIDGRLHGLSWMADTLLQVPSDPDQRVPGGVLDLDTAWAYALRHLLGLSSGRPTAEALLRWSAEPGAAARYERVPAEARGDVRARLEETAGTLAQPLAAALEAGRGAWLLPLGLACEVLFPDGARGAGELSGAGYRIERYLGDTPLEPGLAARWAEAALRALDRVTEPQAAAVLAPAGELLQEVGAADFVGLSTVLPGGWQRRLARFAGALDAAAEDPSAIRGLERAFAAVLAHRDAGRPAETERVERLEMALRLARRLALAAGAAPRSLSEAARAYACDGGYVDWARSLLLGGESNPALAASLDALSHRARAAREADNRAFATLLAGWTRSPGGDAGVLPIERVLADVVAPAAAEGPTLVLVLDGMSYAAFRQIAADLRTRGWEQWSRDASPSVVLATVPCVTQVSRASLFAGRVTTGGGGDEARGFARHAALAALSQKAPVLFHKGDLAEGPSATLSEAVRSALCDVRQKVVGVVLNVLDDWLARSDQASARWTLDRIRLLDSLLYEAQVAGRLVVLASDHGHVLDADSRELPGGEHERWRVFAEPLAQEETAISGPRVQAAAGVASVVVPWSEQVRYTRPKAGYHGGATPQEMLVPVSIWAPWDRQLAGWHVVREEPPRWWSAEAPAAPLATPALLAETARRPRVRVASEAQPSLFGEAPGAEQASAAADWITSLLVSDVYAAQRALAGRLAPPDETVRTFLELSGRHYGRIPRGALVRALRQPEIRIRGVVAVLQRLLNVDGYPVVAADDASELVTVEHDLLRRQFQLAPADGA
ncbi:MAG: pglZ [Gemmatimonadetes bacterium]|nr:pglZ [Gemmatimonadota bacterium]